MTLLVSIWFIGQQAYTGGTNGITNLGSAQIFGQPLLSPNVQKGFYLTAVVCLALVYILCVRIVQSRFGRVLVATRDNENRVRFLGYNPVTVKVMVFAVSAAIAALAGILYVPLVGIISPSNMAVVPSIEIVIWVAVGGRGTLIGAIIGALAVSYGRSYLSESYPDVWQIFMGALFIGSVLLFPQGIVGSLQLLAKRLQGKPAQQEATPRAENLPAERLISIQPSQAEGQS